METESSTEGAHLKIRRRAFVVAATSIAAAAVIYSISKTILIPVQVDGVSMEPTLRDGSIHLVNTLAYRSTPPARGDVVVATVDGEEVVKRISSLPGETIVLAEDGPLAPARQLGPDEYFITSDHEESYSYLIHRSNLVGRVLFCR